MTFMIQHYTFFLYFFNTFLLQTFQHQFFFLLDKITHFLFQEVRFLFLKVIRTFF